MDTQITTFDPLSPYLTYESGKVRHYVLPVSVVMNLSIKVLKKTCQSVEMEYHDGADSYLLKVEVL